MISVRSERNATIEAHHYLCLRAARKFIRDGSDRRDLEQVAAIGLIKAADRYQAHLGTPFEAYAWTFILGELMHYVRDHERLVRIPRRLRDLERRWSGFERDLRTELGRDPNPGEIGARMQLRREEYEEILRFRQSAMIVSVDALQPSEQQALSYTMEPHVDRLAVETALTSLTELEQRVLSAIYERDVPIVELAKELGYSRRHVTRIHRSALEKLENAARPIAPERGH